MKFILKAGKVALPTIIMTIFVQDYKRYNETHKTNPKNELHSLTQYTNKVKKQYYISLAFVWDETNHGFHFWNKINKKWNDTLNVQHSTDIFELINYVKSLNL